MSINYAILDDTNEGSLLEITDANMILTYNSTGTDQNRNARADIGVSKGLHYWEIILYSSSGQTMTGTTAFVGLVETNVANNVTPGSVTNSIGYSLGTGQIYVDGVLDQTVTTTGLKSVIGMAFNADSGVLDIYINGAYVTGVDVPPGSLLLWKPAFTVCGAVAYGFSMFVNFGQRDFEMPVPDGYRPGLFTTSQPFSTVYLASEDWISPHDADNPNTLYYGDLLSASKFYIERNVSFSPHGKNQKGTVIPPIDFTRHPRYNNLINNPPRDALVIFKIVYPEDPDNPIQIGVGLIDDVECKDKSTGTLKFKEIQSLLDLPLSKNYFLPYVSEGSAQRIKPSAFGACRNIEPVVIDTANRIYHLSDIPLTQIATIRDKGDRLDPLAAPPDWVATANLQAVQLQTEPDGKLSADVSSSGDSLIVGSPDIDIVEPYGNMATENVPIDMPQGWYKSGTQNRTAIDYFNQRLRLQVNGVIPAGINATWDARFKDLRVPATDWCPVVKGCYYRLTYTIISSNWPTNGGFGQFAAGWFIRGVSGQVASAGGVMTVLAPGTYNVDFRASCDGTLAYYGTGNLDPANYGGSTGPWVIHIDEVKCILKSALVPDVINGEGNFDSSLTGWTIGTHTGTSSVYLALITSEYPSPGIGSMRFTVTAGSGNKGERYYGSAYLGTGVTYRVAFSTATSSTNSKLEVFAYEPVGGTYFLVSTYIGAQNNCEAIITVGVACRLLLRASTTDSLAGETRVSQLRLWNITNQISESSINIPLHGISLAEYFKHIIEVRAKLDSNFWVEEDVSEIDIETKYTFGVYTDNEITMKAMLDAPMESFTSGITEDETGKLRIARMKNPSSIPDEDIILEIDENNAQDFPQIKGDLAPGLTTRWGTRRNWKLHSDGDFVTDTDPVTGIDLGSRERFKRVSQFLTSSPVRIHSNYAHAKDAKPLDSLLDIEADGRTEVDRVCEMFQEPRKLLRLTVYYDGQPLGIIPGKSAVRYTREDADLGFESGKKMLVLESKHWPIQRAYTLYVWG